jgi:hypothetical protein
MILSESRGNIMMQLHIAIDKENLQYRRIEANKIWSILNEDIIKYFEPIVTSLGGDILADSFLLDCYVRTYRGYYPEESIIRNLEKILAQDINFYSPLKRIADENKQLMVGYLRSYNDFAPLTWKDLHLARVLCGPKGTGKTTLLLFSISDIEQDKKNKCFFVRLDIPAGGESNPWGYLTTKLVERIDQYVVDQGKKYRLDPQHIIIKRFDKLWEQVDAIPDPNDDEIEISRKRKLRDEFLINLYRYKYTNMFSQYIKWSIEYLRKEFNISSVIMIDDIDRLENVITARSIVQRVIGLAAELIQVPIVVSAREETLALLADMPLGVRKMHLMPPDFGQVLKKRIGKFNHRFTLDPEKADILQLTERDIKNFVNLVVDSVLDDEVYSNLVAFHYDLDILLDIVICLLGSPFLKRDYCEDLIKNGKNIPWHVILDSIQRYIYKNFYDENSYILNIFDNEQRPATIKNTLIRLRLLQSLRYRFRGINVPVRVEQIVNDLTELGYEKMDINHALKAFSRHRLVVTGNIYNLFKDGTQEILLQPAIVYYLSNLLYNYRYIQNVLPVTPLPFNLPMDLVDFEEPIMGQKLKIIDISIIKFLDFLKFAENEELNQCKNEGLLKEISRDTRFAESLGIRIKQQRDGMMGLNAY